ncbi:3-hydroxyacyl-CoA dehydrogenase NAD-binding domain-containing protein [Leisingera sp. S232]|uniref:3-hydroxyacyl-CoA dehydrogenase NAD-binding domain-containing protein n=1 Tax=Leisingera sp. S232 TaxID=3415132 RepID=UPI003C7BF692
MSQKNSQAQLELTESIAVIQFQNAPMNAMSPGLPGAILQQLRAAQDAGAKAVLLVPGGSGVMAGADISMQGKDWPADEPLMSDLIRTLDDCAVPTAILLRKSALGGGLEIAMACRWRFATAGTKLGQPEVNLGIPPGAGGTQRLPRIVGIQHALDICITGRPIDATKAQSLGLIDALVPAETAQEACLSFLRDALKAGQIPAPAGARQIPEVDESVFETALAQAAKRRRGEAAPKAIIDAIRAAAQLPLSEGLAQERKLYLDCVASDQAAAMRHVFFAERAALKGHTSKEVQARPITKIAVVGAGTMGSGIAMAFLMAGLHVHLAERSGDALQAGLDRIRAFFDGRVKAGRMKDTAARDMLARLSSKAALDDLPPVDLVVEAVFEEMAVKKSVFATLAQATAPGTILATNTSYLDVDEIAAAVPDRVSDVLGMHFFSPANIMPLLEIVRGRDTAEDTLATVLALSKTIGKTGVVSGVCHGFIANRSFSKYLREAEFLLQEGATPAQVDAAIRAFGLPMGPFAVRDLAGLDIGWAMRKSTAHLRNPDERYSTVGDAICERGWFGQKTGRGFFYYAEDKRRGAEDPEVLNIIRETGAAAGITPRQISDQEIVDRCLLAVVNEGAKILQEGIARRASDFDLAWINGYGFPKWRGGPLFWAEQTGLQKVLARIDSFHGDHDFWEPAALLQELAADGKTFAQYTGAPT